jgi:hypothetical protein
MPKITEMYAFVTADQGPDDEGVVGVNTPSGWMPLVGADMKRMEALKPIAKEVARETRKTIRILKFTTMTEVGKISPV